MNIPTETKSKADIDTKKKSDMNADSTSQSSLESPDSRPFNRDPYEIPPYTVSRDSDEYRSWRTRQHQRGMRNLVVAFLVFGGLALFYWYLQSM